MRVKAHMDLGIAGRRALVMGASRGLGRACAVALAREGVELTIVARDPGRLASAAAEIRAATGVKVAPIAADFRTAAGRDAALAGCPSPDILVTNAEGFPPGDFRDCARADWLAAVDDMMLGPIELIRRTVDGMTARRFGRIVNVVSRSVKSPQPDLPLSNGARAGLIGFVAGLARQTVRHNVTINNLLPGIFASDAQRRHVAGLVERTGRAFDDIWTERARTNPAQRYGDPAELGAACAYLCSAQAGYITGQSLLVDGGGFPGAL
jgi:3-oxoacyl-[acyl-carrier protein] reductase